MNRPWMPFHVGDYLGDTGHLSTIQHGAYLLLILHYWRTGGLPEDDAKLARIAKLSVKNWTEFIKPDLEPLFRANWRHKRIDEELEKYEIIRAKRAIAGRKGGELSGVSRAIAKGASLSKHAHREANACHLLGKMKQLPSKREATTTTSLPCLESEHERDAAAVENQQEATNEERKPKPFVRAEFDATLEAKRKLAR
jgi:uncharacterized protein YdaU (DUF1376 family)